MLCEWLQRKVKGASMRRTTVCRMILFTCLLSCTLVIVYFQSTLQSVEKAKLHRHRFHSKSGRSPLQALYDSDQFEHSPLQLIQQKRRSLLNNVCKMYTRKRRVLTTEDLKHLIVDDNHGLLYCYVPKVACTNWKRVMMILSGQNKYSDPLKIPANEAHISSNLKTLSDYSTNEINYRLRNYLKFIFVREPFERLVSAYRNKFTRKYNTAFHKRYGTKIVKRHRRNPTSEALEKGDDVKFNEFVYYLVDPHTQREEPFNEHWERVHSLCHPCIIHYDVIGKYETLADDARYVLQLIGADKTVKFPTSSKSTRTTDDLTAEFFNNLSPFYQKKLYNLYRMDFLLFNYSMPSYLDIR
ncbi:carbohydrate sulfotransferase 11-like [Protopterus annectens]|uniref:carbohydrate sulfotransferase 11-like n=1 Tax=Protopterus annectens TaxID=7888 RepID=UPI001CF950AB|nr:carbohydrate sulfotransferase 11-like [Protopterus annectens]